MPSDVYQAQAIAQLALRFNWTWMGAVVADNSYGHMAVKVLKDFLADHQRHCHAVTLMETPCLICACVRCFKR